MHGIIRRASTFNTSWIDHIFTDPHDVDARFFLHYLEEAIIIRERNYLRIEKQMQQNADLMPVDHSHLSRLSNFAIPIVCKTPELRKQYKSKFEQASIEIRPMIAGNIQRQPFYSKYVNRTFDLSGVDFIHKCGFYCGNYPEMTQEDLSTISDCLEKQ